MSSQRRGRELVHAGSKNPALPGGRIRESRLLSLSSAGGAERDRERGWNGRRWVGCRRRRSVVVLASRSAVQVPVPVPRCKCKLRRERDSARAKPGKRGPWPTRTSVLLMADLLGWWRRNLEANQNSQACCYAAAKLNFRPVMRDCVQLMIINK